MTTSRFLPQSPGLLFAKHEKKKKYENCLSADTFGFIQI